MKKLQLLLLMLLALPIGMLAAGTQWDAATTLPLGQDQTGSLSKDRTEEWWKFTITADGAAQVIVTPGSGLRINDVRLYHYNSPTDFTNYWQRSSNTYYMNPGWNSASFTTPDLAPGTYLLKVQRGEGEASYTIKCVFTANTYSNNKEKDSWAHAGDEKANTMPLNKPVQGHLGYGYGSANEDNEDWWAFTVTEDGEANINIKHDKSLRISDLRLYHYNSVSDFDNYWQRSDNKYYINPGWDEGNLTTPNLAPGTYLIKIARGEGYGGYELTYTFKANGYRNNREPDGWNPNDENKVTPNELPVNQPTHGHLGYGYGSANEDNEDWWTFSVAQDGAATIAISHDATLRVNDVRLYHYEYNDKKEFINYWQRSDDTYYFNPGWNSGSMRIPNLAPGKYLIKVTRGEGWGGYELNYTFEPQKYINDKEPNNSWEEGRDNNYLARGQEKQGHLGYGYGSKNEDNEDWYRITVPRDGKAILKYTPTNVNSALRVNDIRIYHFNSVTDKTNYWQRSSNTYYVNPGWNEASLTTPDLAPGDYLVKVARGEGYGAYALKYEFEQNELPNDAEPNNEWNQPSKLVEGKTQSGHLGYGYANGNEDTYDWYEVTMTKTGTLKINIQPGAKLRIGDVRLYYYSDGKSNYWQRTKGNYYINPGWNAATLTTTDVEAGDYLIRVQRGEGYGNYRIAFNADLKDVTPLDPLPDEDPGNPDNPNNPNNPVIDGPDKDFINEVGKDLLNKWDADSYRSILDLLKQAMSYDTNEISQWGSNALHAMKTAITTPYNGISNGYILMVRAANFTGHFKAVDNRWKYEGPADDLQFTFADKGGTPCVARVVTSGNRKTITIPHEFEDDDEGLLNFKGTKDLTKDVKLISLEVPEHVEISFTYGTTQMMLTTVDFDLSCFTDNWSPTTNGLIVSINSSFVKSNGSGKFEMSMDRTGYQPGTGIKSSFIAKNDGNQIMTFNLEAPGTINMEDGLIDINPETGVSFKDIGIESVKIDLDVVGRIQAHGSVSDVNTFINTMSSVSKCDDAAEAQQLMEKMNDLIDGNFYYDNGTDPKGSLGMGIAYDEEEEEWKLEPTISFTSDHSTYPIKTYFSEENFPEFVGGVKTIFNELREVATTLRENIEKMDEEATNTNPNPSGNEACLIVWRSETQKDYYLLSERPIITMSNGDFILTTTNTTVTYEFEDVMKFTLADDVTTAITEVKAVTEPSVERQSDRVIFTGCKPKSPIRIYSMSGQLVDTQWADEDGRAEVSISGLSAGVYVVKSDNVNIKIAKR